MNLTQTKQFKKDVKTQKKRGKDLDKLIKVVELLIEAPDLPAKYRDHILTGNWIGRKDCHLEPDWILIYKRDESELRLERTGSHSDLF